MKYYTLLYMYVHDHMHANVRIILLLFLCAFHSCPAEAQDGDGPSINPTMSYDEESDVTEILDASAPLTVRFHANASGIGSYSAHYEWRFYQEKSPNEPYLVRYDEDTEVTFTQAGRHIIRLYATFVEGNDTIAYTDNYWQDADPLTVSVSESRLEMPNAFSPNGDNINDIYRAKAGYQSLVSFHAIIINRWGQKLFEWNDPAEGWDGKYNGSDVKDGVYFVIVKAKGADGKTYNIKKDVNLLRGYTEGGILPNE